MATVASPFGMRPINLIGGRSYTHGVRQFSIASGTATDLYFGQPVTLNTSGVIVRDDLSSPRPIGIFMGCSYTDPNMKYKLFKQYWPSGTVASDAVGYVVDDPFALFQIQADGSVALTALGANATVTNPTTGSTLTGNSTMSLASASVATTNTLPLRIVDYVQGPTSAIGDSFTDLIVAWNFGMHSYLNATGI